jgi:hypothetical protein
MQIGRKIYFEKFTGNVILEIGECQGDVIATTIEQDFYIYIALQKYAPEQVGVIQLEYGQYADKFGIYQYHVSPTTRMLVWGNLINSDMPAQQPTLEQQIAEIKENQLITMDAIATLYEKVSGGITA